MTKPRRNELYTDAPSLLSPIQLPRYSPPVIGVGFFGLAPFESRAVSFGFIAGESWATRGGGWCWCPGAGVGPGQPLGRYKMIDVAGGFALEFWWLQLRGSPTVLVGCSHRGFESRTPIRPRTRDGPLRGELRMGLSGFIGIFGHSTVELRPPDKNAKRPTPRERNGSRRPSSHGRPR